MPAGNPRAYNWQQYVAQAKPATPRRRPMVNGLSGLIGHQAPPPANAGAAPAEEPAAYSKPSMPSMPWYSPTMDQGAATQPFDPGAFMPLPGTGLQGLVSKPMTKERVTKPA